MLHDRQHGHIDGALMETVNCDLDNDQIICPHCLRPARSRWTQRNCPRKPIPQADHSSIVKQAIAALGADAESLGLGDMMAATLDAIGITKERVIAWQGEVGPCQGCVDRQEWFNKLGRKITGFLRRKAGPGDSAA
jgi:hypothetical protein